jgi:hypothetical protein
METEAGRAAAVAAGAQTAKACLAQRCVHNPDLQGCNTLIAQGGASAGPMGSLGAPTPAPKPKLKATVTKTTGKSSKPASGALTPTVDKWGPNATQVGPNLQVTNPNTGLKYNLPLTKIINVYGEPTTFTLSEFSFATSKQTPYAAGTYQSAAGQVEVVPGTPIK